MKNIKFWVSILFLFSLLLPAFFHADAARIAVVKEVKGEVYIKKGGGQREFKAKDGMSLTQGDSVRTEGKASANIHYDDGSKATVGANSKLIVSKLDNKDDGKQTKTKVLSGKVWNSVKNLSNVNDEYDIETPTAVMGVRGTHFLVSTDPLAGKSSVSVLEGIVGVSQNIDSRNNGSATNGNFSLAEQLVTINHTLVTATNQAAIPEAQLLDVGQLIGQVEPVVIVEIIQDLTRVIKETNEKALAAQKQFEQTKQEELIKTAIELSKTATALANIQETVLKEISQSSIRQEVERILETTYKQTLDNIIKDNNALKTETATTQQQVTTAAKNSGLTQEQIDKIGPSVPSSTNPNQNQSPQQSGNTTGGGGEGSTGGSGGTINPIGTSVAIKQGEPLNFTGGISLNLGTLDIPSGASVTVKSVDPNTFATTGLKPAGAIASFTFAGIDVSNLAGKGVTLTLPYTSASSDIGIFYQNSDGTWQYQQSSEVNPTAKTVTATVSHFSTYGVFEGPVPKPTANPPVGIVDVGQEITLQAMTEGADIYYTIDGTTPTKNNKIVYDSTYKPRITSDQTVIKAIAVKDGIRTSEVASFEYTLENTIKRPAAPKISGSPDGFFYIDITNHEIHALLKLYDADTDSVVQTIDNADNGPRFIVNLNGKRYYVTQTVNGIESRPSNVVIAEDSYPIPPSLTLINSKVNGEQIILTFDEELEDSIDAGNFRVFDETDNVVSIVDITVDRQTIAITTTENNLTSLNPTVRYDCCSNPIRGKNGNELWEFSINVIKNVGFDLDVNGKFSIDNYSASASIGHSTSSFRLYFKPYANGTILPLDDIGTVEVEASYYRDSINRDLTIQAENGIPYVEVLFSDFVINNAIADKFALSVIDKDNNLLGTYYIERFDDVPPIFENGTPTTNSVHPDRVTFNIDVTENSGSAHMYYVVMPSGEPTLTADQVTYGAPANAIRAESYVSIDVNKPSQLTIIGLEPNQTYDIYMIAVDYNNLSELKMVTVTTPDTSDKMSLLGTNSMVRYDDRLCQGGCQYNYFTDKSFSNNIGDKKDERFVYDFPSLVTVNSYFMASTNGDFEGIAVITLYDQLGNPVKTIKPVGKFAEIELTNPVVDVKKVEITFTDDPRVADFDLYGTVNQDTVGPSSASYDWDSEWYSPSRDKQFSSGDTLVLTFNEPLNPSKNPKDAITTAFNNSLGTTGIVVTNYAPDDTVTFLVKYNGAIPIDLAGGKTITFAPETIYDLSDNPNSWEITFVLMDDPF
ncbi:MAG TPA: hypothetical protein GX497_11355 [Bacillus bacterium]|nr:hypothetical protein [Bacillus sp. (in: firmicutes)]